MFRKFEAKFFSKLNVDKMLIFSGRWEKDGGWGVNVSRRRCISGNNHIVNVFVPPKVVRFDLLFAMYSSTKAKEKDEKNPEWLRKRLELSRNWIQRFWHHISHHPPPAIYPGLYKSYESPTLKNKIENKKDKYFHEFQPLNLHGWRRKKIKSKEFLPQ